MEASPQQRRTDLHVPTSAVGEWGHQWIPSDSTLANLDVHLRAAMEKEFARFHERTATTTIYITHDQAEAMALADRIAVMSHGRILQFAAPSQLYREPASSMR